MSSTNPDEPRTPPEAGTPARTRRSGRPVLLAVAVGVTGLLIFGASLFSFLTWQKESNRRAEQDNHTVVDTVRKVARLTTIEMNVSSFQRRRDSKKLWGFIPIRCEKTVAVFYRGRVAAGFDLQDQGALTIVTDVTPTGRHLRIGLPVPKLLYTDAPPPEVVVDDGSLCNRFEPTDYEQLHQSARAAMETEALAKGILAQAESSARELLTTVGTALGYEVVVTIDRPPGPALGIPAGDHPDGAVEGLSAGVPR